jgi:hypothetical protein
MDKNAIRLPERRKALAMIGVACPLLLASIGQAATPASIFPLRQQRGQAAQMGKGRQRLTEKSPATKSQSGGTNHALRSAPPTQEKRETGERG